MGSSKKQVRGIKGSMACCFSSSTQPDYYPNGLQAQGCTFLLTLNAWSSSPSMRALSRGLVLALMA